LALLGVGPESEAESVRFHRFHLITKAFEAQSFRASRKCWRSKPISKLGLSSATLRDTSLEWGISSCLVILDGANSGGTPWAKKPSPVLRSRFPKSESTFAGPYAPPAARLCGGLHSTRLVLEKLVWCYVGTRSHYRRPKGKGYPHQTRRPCRSLWPPSTRRRTGAAISFNLLP
jgi:hypothetical protein